VSETCMLPCDKYVRTAAYRVKRLECSACKLCKRVRVE
jgi:hypothetical protein